MSATASGKAFCIDYNINYYIIIILTEFITRKLHLKNTIKSVVQTFSLLSTLDSFGEKHEKTL